MDTPGRTAFVLISSDITERGRASRLFRLAGDRRDAPSPQRGEPG